MSRGEDDGRDAEHKGPRPHHHVTGHNPAHPPIQRYAPSVWHRDHRYAIGLIVGATVITLITGFLGPSVVTLTLGPRDSLLPPWYLPAGIVEPNEWVVTVLVWMIITRRRRSGCGSGSGRWPAAGCPTHAGSSGSAPASAW